MSATHGGKWLEEEITRIANDYDRRRVLSLNKVDPPTRMIMDKRTKRWIPIHLANPFLDFVGAWTEQRGRGIFLEAKSTTEPRLQLGSGGISDNQWIALQRWRKAGAAVGVLWGYTPTHEIRFVPFELIESQLRNDAKHVKWQHASEIPRGLGFCTWNFAAILAEYHPANAKIAQAAPADLVAAVEETLATPAPAPPRKASKAVKQPELPLLPAEPRPPKFWGIGGQCTVCEKPSSTARMFHTMGPHPVYIGMLEQTSFVCESCAAKDPAFAAALAEAP